jgi:5'-nucleotidase
MRIGGLAALLASIAALALGGCGTTNIGAPAARPPRAAPVQPADGAVEVTLIAFNDFHGNLEPPQRPVVARGPAGEEVRVPAGGAAHLAAAIESLRAKNPNHLVLSAGDLISASPLISSLFLDEPTIHAMNMIRLDFNAVGNHEFDRGRAELLRLDRGGCEKHTNREPCAVDRDFRGADFGFLAANVVTEAGNTLFPAYAMRSFGSGAARVDVGIIGLTLEDTPSLVTPEGISGLTFRDEADTINALVPRLEAEGAELIVVVIHEGLRTEAGYNDKTCEGISGDLMPILQRLSPKVDVIISGHTHQAYICDFGTIDPTRPFLATSAAAAGALLTEIRLTVDPRTGRTISRRADNHIVQVGRQTTAPGEVPTTNLFPRYAPVPAIVDLVDRYRRAAEPAAARVVGRLSSQALREANPAGESALGNLIADAQLTAMRVPERGGAQIAFMNSGGLRADLVPAADGSLTYGQAYSVQPFGNTLATRSFTGRQIRGILEQQWASGSNSVEKPNILLPSAGFTYSYDLSKPAGQRVMDMRLNGQPVRDDQTYRVALSNFLASGGDNFTGFRQGTDQVGGPLDLDALEAYLRANPRLAPPMTDRIRRLDAPPAEPGRSPT